ncbi:universal stress protein [Natrarchaeobaculum aegyptiacum]|uniref:Universal stress protein n=1 Tax=Natrarchaeobaculum aegyptiacum TaxID=745377 RepID=A0A2Z2HUU7_9EURY|nr:universal stress protein [Natrarchaeobaculum aegyptiacum]ARS89297.1 universal stress protein [Natrarchaeobaculum aegyptiacum]
MSRPIDSILIPTDGSDGALAGANCAVALASRIDADVQIHALAVVDDPDWLRNFDDDVVAALEEDATEAVEAIEELVSDHDDVTVTTVVKRGTPFQTIREYAYRREIDVITMGTTGRTGLGKVLLGSVTENVLRTAHVPVLAVPPNADVESAADVSFDRLLLPTDGSEGAAIATQWGVALARSLESTLHAFSAVDAGPIAQVTSPDDALAALEQRSEAAVDAILERAAAADVSVSGTVTTGSATDAILEHASDEDVDLIVMGTHGQTGVGQWFLGSVTENVVRQATVPVFCVPVSADAP